MILTKFKLNYLCLGVCSSQVKPNLAIYLYCLYFYKLISFHVQASCLPPSVPECEQKLQFSMGSSVILPPESFLSLRLPFVYGVKLEDESLYPLRPFESQPELTAWITKGTTLQVLSKGNNLDVM